jgi:hypothetical protein
VVIRLNPSALNAEHPVSSLLGSKFLFFFLFEYSFDHIISFSDTVLENRCQMMKIAQVHMNLKHLPSAYIWKYFGITAVDAKKGGIKHATCNFC